MDAIFGGAFASGPPSINRVVQMTDEFRGCVLNRRKWFPYSPYSFGNRPGLFVSSNVFLRYQRLHLTAKCDGVPDDAPNGFSVWTTGAVVFRLFPKRVFRDNRSGIDLPIAFFAFYVCRDASFVNTCISGHKRHAYMFTFNVVFEQTIRHWHLASRWWVKTTRDALRLMCSHIRPPANTDK